MLIVAYFFANSRPSKFPARKKVSFMTLKANTASQEFDPLRMPILQQRKEEEDFFFAVGDFAEMCRRFGVHSLFYVSLFPSKNKLRDKKCIRTARLGRAMKKLCVCQILSTHGYRPLFPSLAAISPSPSFPASLFS